MSETGGPAFPHVADLVQHLPNGGIATRAITSGGMTLRDYFAAKAMQAFLINRKPHELDEPCSNWADDAYEIADAMLGKRNAD